MTLIIKEELPFAILESLDFCNCVELCNLKFIPLMINSTAISDLIMSHFCTTKAEIKALLASKLNISLIRDFLTSTNGCSIFRITAHRIAHDFKPRTTIIAMKQVICQHTFLYLTNHLHTVLLEYNIVDNIP